MPTRVYACVHCSQIFDDLTEALVHEMSCTHDPKLRHCHSCYYCEIDHEDMFCERSRHEYFCEDEMNTTCPDYINIEEAVAKGL